MIITVRSVKSWRLRVPSSEKTVIYAAQIEIFIIVTDISSVWRWSLDNRSFVKQLYYMF